MLCRSWPCYALFLVFLGACSILQDNGSSSQSRITTPARSVQSAQPAKDSRKALAVPAQQVQPQTQALQQPFVPAEQPKMKVALLAPLSGKSATLGQSMVNAAQLAVFDMGVNQFELMPRDTKGTPDGAVQAAREAVAGGAKLLIGPLFAADVAAVKPVVRESGVNMLALSTDVSLAETGSFVMGFAPTPQVDRVVSYAAASGLKNFAALVPNGPYGQLVSKAFENAVKQNKGTIVVLQNGTNIDSIVAQKDKIDAIFAPYGGSELRKITAALSAAGFASGNVRLLGTGLWDEANLAQGESLLIGGWFAAAEPDARERFMQNYQETYGQAAPRLATLAYDATALATVLARTTGNFETISLCAPSGFAGLDGIFRLLPSGQIERGLAVLEVTAGGTRIADPAPASFSGR